MKNCTTTILGLGVLLLGAASAKAVDVDFVKLSGITGGQIAGTGVWRADLSDVPLDFITQIVITDTSHGFGGYFGQFSGFDLDAIKLSTTSVDSASGVNALTPVPVFNYFPAADATSVGTFFSPGTQRPVADPKLFGSVLSPNRVDPTVATLGSFDGNATIYAPYVKGFVSMGDDGVLTFNLTSPIDTSVTDFSLFLYIGEVGDNGETAGGSVFDTTDTTPNDFRVQVNGLVHTVPEPASIALALCGGLGIAGLIYRRRVK